MPLFVPVFRLLCLLSCFWWWFFLVSFLIECQAMIKVFLLHPIIWNKLVVIFPLLKLYRELITLGNS